MERIEDLDKLKEIATEITNKSNNRILPEVEIEWANCWGFVAAAMGWRKAYCWLEDSEMEDHLSKHTKPITPEDASTGDILVYRHPTSNQLIHTAIVVVPEQMILHKRGTLPVSAEGPCDEPCYQPSNMSYVRVIE